MAKCGIGVLLGTECGSSSYRRRKDEAMVTLEQCERDISAHLKMMKINKEGISSEGDLILLRAGKVLFFFLSFGIDVSFVPNTLFSSYRGV